MEIQIEAHEGNRGHEEKQHKCGDMSNGQATTNKDASQNKQQTDPDPELAPVGLQLRDVTFVQLTIEQNVEKGVVKEATFDHVANIDPAKTLYVKYHKPIEVSKFWNEEGIYLSAAFSHVPWPKLEIFGNAMWAVLQGVLELGADEIGYAQGLLVVGTHFYPAAKFLLTEECNRNIDDPDVQRRISVCMKLLADRALWKYDVATDPEGESARLVATVRRAREQIPGKKLPCICSIESSVWRQPIEVPPSLVESKPVLKNEVELDEVGTITGYCRERHIIHFRFQRTGKLVDIGFDAETFFLRVFKVLRIKPKTLRLQWTEKFEGLTLSSRTLNSIEVITDALC